MARTRRRARPGASPAGADPTARSGCPECGHHIDDHLAVEGDCGKVYGICFVDECVCGIRLGNQRVPDNWQHRFGDISQLYGGVPAPNIPAYVTPELAARTRERYRLPLSWTG